MRHFIVLLLIFIFASCKQSETKSLYELEAFTPEEVLRAVIEIPAGTNSKVEYSKRLHDFAIDQIDGQDRIIQYLAYPANYGFIPGTQSDKTKGGDGDALDILVLASSLPTGTVIEVIPIAVYKLLDNGEIDYKIIAIPKEKTLQTIKAETLSSFISDYPKARSIISMWFLNYNPKDPAKNIGWGDEKDALIEIKKALKPL